VDAEHLDRQREAIPPAGPHLYCDHTARSVQRRRAVNGNDKGPLGVLYRPRYFNGGIAVHGYTSVPSYPASHGCVRVSNAAMDWIWANQIMAIGSPVWVH
jgi:lipoprotein-anchoring transpeptidase ErfK/SrfK